MTDSEQPHKYCHTCGAEQKAESNFCVTCGKHLVPPPEGLSSASSAPPLPNPPPSFYDGAQEKLQGGLRWLRASSPDLNRGALKRLLRRALQWFKSFPGVLKLAIVGLIMLMLLTILSPLALVAAALVFGVSIVVLIVRVTQQKSFGSWGLVAAISLVLLFTFGSLSEILYGVGLPEIVSERDAGGGGESP